MYRNEWIVAVDAGHGGLDSEGNYTTAPSKMFRFPKDTFEGHGDGYVYEGVLNRHIAMRTVQMLRRLGVNAIPLNNGYEDTPLGIRVKMVNELEIANGGKVLLVSEHCNASPGHNASGFEVYTSKGYTQSDMFASAIYSGVKASCPYIQKRKDYIDGDPDKERSFQLLTDTTCSAVLIENGFMDYLQDARRLFDNSWLHRLTVGKCTGILKGINKAKW